MRAVFRVEIYGDNYIWMAKHKRDVAAKKLPLREEINIIRYGRRECRPWVAKLLGLNDQYGFTREFVQGYKDYSKATRSGSRGVFVMYPLSSGVYEVNHCIRLGVPRRYFIRVQDTAITEIFRNEVLQCLTKTSGT